VKNIDFKIISKQPVPAESIDSKNITGQDIDLEQNAQSMKQI